MAVFVAYQANFAISMQLLPITFRSNDSISMQLSFQAVAEILLSQ